MATLGSDSDAQKIDSIRDPASSMDTTDDEAGAAANRSNMGLERFYLQYFFPPSSVGECGRVGPAGKPRISCNQVDGIVRSWFAYCIYSCKLSCAGVFQHAAH